MACSSRDGCGRGVILGLALVLFGPGLSIAGATPIETRDFVVQVDGKKAGVVHMTIEQHDKGVTKMRCETDIAVKALIVRYRFSFRGQEVWQNRRLVRFDSTTDDNGLRYVISAVAEPGGVRLRVNNVERMVPADIWLSTYWSLPDPKFRNQVVPLIDADDGKNIASKLQFVGMENRLILGQRVNVQRWRLTGKVNIDLWYDGQERLVRQEWVEQGHRTALELVEVRR